MENPEFPAFWSKRGGGGDGILNHSVVTFVTGISKTELEKNSKEFLDNGTFDNFNKDLANPLLQGGGDGGGEEERRRKCRSFFLLSSLPHSARVASPGFPRKKYVSGSCFKTLAHIPLGARSVTLSFFSSRLYTHLASIFFDLVTQCLQRVLSSSRIFGRSC